GNNVVQNILPGSTLYNSTRTLSSGLNQQHAANARYEWKLDSLTSFKLTTTGTMKRTTYEDSTFFSALNGKNELLNNTRRYTERLNDRLQSDNQLQYKQLFKKKNRQLLATFRFGYTEDDLSGLNYAQIRTYEGGVVDQDSIVDQQRRFNGHSVTWGGKVTYTEPLNAKWSIVTEYSHNDNSSKSVKESFNKSNNGKYETLDPQFSNRFELDVASNGGILIGKYFTKKVKFAFGSGLSAVKLNLFNIDSQARKVYNFRNITPQASFGYMLKQNSNISFNYRGTTRQPTIDQLQPFRDNTDPNNLFIGNPDLKVSFTHNISMFYNSYKVLTGRGIWINASYNVTENAITNENNFDVATGKRTYRPVNVDGNKNIWYWAEWNHGEGEKKWIHTVRTSGNGGRYNNFVQGQKVRTDYATFEFGYGIRYEVSEKYSIHISPEGGYNLSNSSLKTPINNNYFSYGGRVEGKLNLTKKLELWSETNFELREKFKLPDNFSFPGLNLRQNIILWNAHLSYQVFKDKSGKIFLSANDLLNQNQGFSRQITSNMISEDRYQRIARYVMLRFEWTFNKMPGQK
ncbi:MAG TPA: outer membrane beta-barrel protein, partial [Chitinophagaceae bacterium]|nr:outer membrane beta-barrel protein [Chitinophagaceae bacterium]